MDSELVFPAGSVTDAVRNPAQIIAGVGVDHASPETTIAVARRQRARPRAAPDRARASVAPPPRLVPCYTGSPGHAPGPIRNSRSISNAALRAFPLSSSTPLPSSPTPPGPANRRPASDNWALCDLAPSRFSDRKSRSKSAAAGSELIALLRCLMARWLPSK
jgi:hypothetical protein